MDHDNDNDPSNYGLFFLIGVVLIILVAMWIILD